MATFGNVFNEKKIKFNSSYPHTNRTYSHLKTWFNSSVGKVEVGANEELELVQFKTIQHGCMADLCMYVMYDVNDQDNYYDRITERYYFQKYNEFVDNWPYTFTTGMFYQLPDTPENATYGVSYGNHAHLTKEIFFSYSGGTHNYWVDLDSTLSQSHISYWNSYNNLNDKFIFKGPCETFFIQGVQGATENGKAFEWEVEFILRSYPGG